MANTGCTYASALGLVLSAVSEKDSDSRAKLILARYEKVKAVPIPRGTHSWVVGQKSYFLSNEADPIINIANWAHRWSSCQDTLHAEWSDSFLHHKSVFNITDPDVFVLWAGGPQAMQVRALVRKVQLPHRERADEWALGIDRVYRKDSQINKLKHFPGFIDQVRQLPPAFFNEGTAPSFVVSLNRMIDHQRSCILTGRSTNAHTSEDSLALGYLDNGVWNDRADPRSATPETRTYRSAHHEDCTQRIKL